MTLVTTLITICTFIVLIYYDVNEMWNFLKYTDSLMYHFDYNKDGLTFMIEFAKFCTKIILACGAYEIIASLLVSIDKYIDGSLIDQPAIKPETKSE